MIKNILTILILLLAPNAFGQNNWKLVYAHNAEGQATFGNLTDLIGAVRAGKDVKIGWKMGSGSKFVEHTAQAQFLTIMDSTVYAQITPIIGQQPSFTKRQITFHEHLQWSMIASTNGKNDTMMKDVSSGTILDHSLYRWATKWFVRE